MKYFLFMVFAYFACLPVFGAEAVPFSRILSEVTPGKPACFGREYSESHMKAHPIQTVKLFRAKISKQVYGEGENTGVTNVLQIAAVLKGEKNRYKLWRNAMACTEEGNCSIDCDGGSAKLSGLSTGGLLLQNNGFVLEGGCGSEDGQETVFLDSKPGGDDVFRLVRLPSEFCADEGSW